MPANSHAATVEVLTAEVRVLMVGSRQITLSVYAQLDTVDDTGIEPFGRVRARSDDQGYIHVIGREKDTGELVRSQRPGIGLAIRSRVMSECGNQRARDVCVARFRLRDKPGPYFEKRDHESLLERHPEIVKQADELELTLEAQAAEWGLLPLIVLAGLR